jgi:hypothetical protein
MRRSLPGIVMVVLLASACTKDDSPTAPTPPTPAADSPTTVAFVSAPASPVGRGESPPYTVRNATFQVGTDSRFVSVAVLPLGATDAAWRFVVQPPAGQVLAPGTFPIAGSGPSSTGHGLEFSGGGNRCGGPGTLTIEDVRNAGGLVERLRVNFSLSCGGAAVDGRIVLNWVAGVGYR